MGLSQLNLEGKNKVEVAIARLQSAAMLAGSVGLYVAFSGGKDSIAIEDLTVRSGVPFDIHYNMTGVDPPELVQFIRDCYSEVQMHRPPESIFKGIMLHGLPRRQGRWCCELLKEYAGSGRYVITGVRWAESPRRQKRRVIEVCRSDKTKFFVNPILDWSTSEVWEYLESRELLYPSLYDEGASRSYKGNGTFKRLGCVLCPMTTHRKTMIEAARWPKLAEAWRRAAYRFYERGTSGVERWTTFEAFWRWWLSRKGEPKVNDAQCVLFE